MRKICLILTIFFGMANVVSASDQSSTDNSNLWNYTNDSRYTAVMSFIASLKYVTSEANIKTGESGSDLVLLLPVVDKDTENTGLLSISNNS